MTGFRVHGVDRWPRAAWVAITLLAATVLLAPAARAQPVTMDSLPADLARAALGGRAGTAVAAVWRDGQLQLAGWRSGVGRIQGAKVGLGGKNAQG